MRGVTAGKILSMPTSQSPYSGNDANDEPFYFQGSVVIPVLGASAVALQFTVPANKNGLLWKLGIDYVGGGFTEGQGVILWRIFRDKALTRAVYGFNNLVASIGAVNNPVEIKPIRVYEAEVISIVVFNVALNPVPPNAMAVGVIHGWWYPKSNENPARYP